MGIELAAVEVTGVEATRAAVEVRLADGKVLAFQALTPQAPGAGLGKRGFLCGPPALYVARLDADAVRRAVATMASELSGYWLRIYGRASAEPAPAKPKVKGPALAVASVGLTDVEPKRSPARCSAVAQVRLTDGREFSILTASPAWFAEAFQETWLAYFYGPSVLFLSSVEAKLARQAAEDLLARGDRWLCLYDSPRTTLARVLVDFKARHQ
ncbi:MAG: hypothetical protein HY554_10300 [Elusimicrobia bacterium]|nr:hypothetical protein [Elusimicrobiota bacterium]